MTFDGTKITLDVDGYGSVTADLAEWGELIKAIGGADKLKQAKLQVDLIELPNDTHIEVEAIIELAEKQKVRPVSASFSQRTERVVTALERIVNLSEKTH